MAYTFTTKVAARGYHVYKNTTWIRAKAGDKVKVSIETDKKSRDIDPYACAIKCMVGSPEMLKTVGHIPREISRHTYFFLKEEGGTIDGIVQSVQYRPSPIPAGGLEIPLLLTFKSRRYITHTKMKEFVTTLYSYEYTGTREQVESESSDDEINFFITESTDSEGEERPNLLQAKDPQPAVTKSRSENNAHNDQESDSEIVNVIAKRKRKKRVPVVVSSDSSGSSDDETLEQIKRKRVAEIGDETPELFCIDPSEMCEIVIEK